MPIRVKRLSDGAVYELKDVSSKSFVQSAKTQLRKEFPPKYKNGCRLQFNGKVMKSRHHLKHYKVGDDTEIEMNDIKNWSSSSSSSSSTD